MLIKETQGERIRLNIIHPGAILGEHINFYVSNPVQYQIRRLPGPHTKRVLMGIVAALNHELGKASG